MGGQVIRLPESADQCGEQAPRETARNGDHPASALHGHGTADDILLPQIPRCPGMEFASPFVRIPSGPVETTRWTTRSSWPGGTKMITSPCRTLFDTAGNETGSGPPAERGAACSRRGRRPRCFSHPIRSCGLIPSIRASKKWGLPPFCKTSSIFSQNRPVRLTRRM